MYVGERGCERERKKERKVTLNLIFLLENPLETECNMQCERHSSGDGLSANPFT